jgi:hypothetical protein
MVINMNEAKLRTIAQLQDFLKATPEVSFSGYGEKDDVERYAHISQVLKRFDYPHRKKPERGVVLAYLQHTSGYSRAQIKRLVARWHENRLAEVPLAKRYRAPAEVHSQRH